MSPDEVLPSGDPSLTPFVVLMALGFVIGAGGSVYKSKTATAIGIGLIFMATLGLPFVLYFGGD